MKKVLTVVTMPSIDVWVKVPIDIIGTVQQTENRPLFVCVSLGHRRAERLCGKNDNTRTHIFFFMAIDSLKHSKTFLLVGVCNI